VLGIGRYYLWCEAWQLVLGVGGDHLRTICVVRPFRALGKFVLFLTPITKVSGNKILPVVLYGCKIWHLKFKVFYKLQISNNRVLWETFLPKRE
jgi:hypothetical protein